MSLSELAAACLSAQMLHARKTGLMSSHYEIDADGAPVAGWDPSWWRSGGTLELEGRQYTVKANLWGSTYGMARPDGTAMARADHVGRKRWTVTSEGRTYDFQRASMWSREQVLLSGAQRAGSVRRTSMWRSDATADLPGLALPVQVFAFVVVLTMWDRADASAAGGAVAAGGAAAAAG
jgi:hypothetical protein